MNKILFAIICLSLFLIPSYSYAFMGCDITIVPCGTDENDDGEISGGEMCQFSDIFILVNNILVYVMTCLAPIVSAIMLIFGGFYYMIAGVNPGKLEEGKKIITAAIVGLVIIFVAWILLNTFLTSMGVAEWTGLNTWWDFNY
jgi:hypothetical protein